SLAGVTGFDSGLAVYAGACGNLTLVSCDDDGADTGNYSRITLTGRTPGEVVYVRVWEYLNDEAEPFSIGAYDSSLSSPSFDASGLRAYPNPVRDILNISYTMTIDSVEIFNLLGQRVSVKAVNQNALELNVSNLPSGTYLVKVNAQGGSETLKVLKP
ncbi:MAG TPA: T9SS type A sorting domain-containing protein, partial [Flavobacterium sp.]|nr:T9SS type A sorting domain-containing protein [Flavobacterium sp.]